MKHHLTVITAALVLAFATTACATAPPPTGGSSINLVMGGWAPSRQEADDATLLAKANNAINRSGFPGLAPYLEPLQAALARTPASYPAIETLPNGDTVIRGNDESDGMMLSIMVGAMSSAQGKDSRLIQAANVYPSIAMLLGSEAVERGAFSDAHRYLDRGLALQPDNWLLLAEKSATYLGQRNWTKALEIADAALASDDILISTHDDVFLRKRGFALVELGQLKEAREAYVKAIASNEDDDHSRSEIKYIDGLLAGDAPTGSVMVSPASRPDQLPQ